MTTPLTDAEVDWLARIALDWQGYATRFGIAEEVNQGAITEEELLQVAGAVSRLLATLAARDEEMGRMRALVEQQNQWMRHADVMHFALVDDHRRLRSLIEQAGTIYLVATGLEGYDCNACGYPIALGDHIGVWFDSGEECAEHRGICPCEVGALINSNTADKAKGESDGV